MLYRTLKPLLFRLEPERAHALANGLLRQAAAVPMARWLLRWLYCYHDPILETRLAGLRLANPVGLAAGYDKSAALVRGLALLGFGALEVGTITPRPQAGNPQPRLFRLPQDLALINRMGFNNPGMLAAAQNLRAARPYGIPVGVNIGKNRDSALADAVADYLAAFYALAPLADYIVLNVSSPNTPGLRALQRQEPLRELLHALQAANTRLRRPLLVKVSPDESPAALDELLAVALECGIAGLIASNTTTARPALRSPQRDQSGGLSGLPLRPRMLAVLRHLAQAADGRLGLVAAGGISSADSAYAAIRAGACCVQIYSGLVYAGPGLPLALNRGLATRLHDDGFVNVSTAVGKS